VRVHKERRGHGIGEALIKDAIAKAEKAGCGMVQLTTDKKREKAIQFYEKLGFEASHLGMKLNLPKK
ncbi:MAG: GNAT family N-acetyltransferase, partial [Sphingomonadales bacterium]